MKSITLKHWSVLLVTAILLGSSFAPGAMSKFLYATGKYMQPGKLNSFAFGKVFSHVLNNKL